MNEMDGIDELRLELTLLRYELDNARAANGAIGSLATERGMEVAQLRELCQRRQADIDRMIGEHAEEVHKLEDRIVELKTGCEAAGLATCDEAGAPIKPRAGQAKAAPAERSEELKRITAMLRDTQERVDQLKEGCHKLGLLTNDEEGNPIEPLYPAAPQEPPDEDPIIRITARVDPPPAKQEAAGMLLMANEAVIGRGFYVYACGTCPALMLSPGHCTACLNTRLVRP